MIVVLFLPLLVIGAVVYAVLQHRHGQVDPAQFLRTIALSLAILFAVFGGLFIAGETFDDPGGWTAAALVVGWLVPLMVLVGVAWRWPYVAVVLLGVLVAGVVATGVWYALDSNAWRSFEDDTGPVRAIAVFALSLPLAVLAWRRPMLGGALLVVLAVVPGALALISTGGGGAGGSTVAVMSPAALVGFLYLAVGFLQKDDATPSSPRTRDEAAIAGTSTTCARPADEPPTF
jgi:MFS family permease